MEKIVSALMFKYLKSYKDKVLIMKNEKFLINQIHKIGNSQIEADCWMAGQCWMTISPNNIRLEVKTLISFISCHPTILVYKLKH